MSRKRNSLSVSVRRHFVDLFFSSQGELLRGKSIIDIGGKKDNKRGLFDIAKYSSKVKYVNIDRTTNPDIVSDATLIPLPENSFDIVILGEILEHVPDPLAVLREAQRLVKPEGKILATVPFMYPIHADPYDFGRYTDYYWQEAATKLGFKDIKVERHGTMFAVLALMIQHFFRSKKVSWRPIQTPLVKFCMYLDSRTKAELLKSWTTGYGIILTK
jgi:SAM-dependent methyltransferase